MQVNAVRGLRANPERSGKYHFDTHRLFDPHRHFLTVSLPPGYDDVLSHSGMSLRCPYLPISTPSSLQH